MTHMLDYLLENGIKSVVFWVIGLLALWLGFAAFGFGQQSVTVPSVPAAKWQAVFLNNNQVYFGKLKDYNANYLALSNVYYLRSATDLDQTPTTPSNLNLIKLGGEVHGPEDTIYIPKSSVLFFENMKDASRVVQTIINAKQ